MRTLQAYLLASRPKTLTAILSPLVVGGGLALHDGLFSLSSFLLTLFTGLGLQITTNLANDYYDFIKGADSPLRKGPLRMTQGGLISPSSMKRATYLCLLATALLGSCLALSGGMPFVLLLLLSLVLSLAYTAGPFPLAYLGLGDLFVFIFFGPIAVGGTYYLQTHEVTTSCLLIGLGLGALCSEILSLNNLRDVEEDSLSHKRTLIVRFGITFGKVKYLLSLLFAATIPFFFLPSHPFCLLSLSAFAFAYKPLVLVFTYQDASELNEALAAQAKLLLAYALLFSLGFFL